jgi:hypothetical protein
MEIQHQKKIVSCRRVSVFATEAGGTLFIRFSFNLSDLVFNPVNAELNPICHLLALAGAHHFVDVSRIRVNRLSSVCVLTFCLHVKVIRQIFIKIVRKTEALNTN